MLHAGNARCACCVLYALCFGVVVPRHIRGITVRPREGIDLFFGRVDDVRMPPDRIARIDRADWDPRLEHILVPHLGHLEQAAGAPQ